MTGIIRKGKMWRQAHREYAMRRGRELSVKDTKDGPSSGSSERAWSTFSPEPSEGTDPAGTLILETSSPQNRRQ